MMKKEMERIDMPDVHEFLDILKASGVKLWACKLAMDMFHYTKEDLYDDVDGVITVGDFYKQGSGVEVIERIGRGEKRAQNLRLLQDLCDTMSAGSLCALGSLTPLPVLSALKHFPADFARDPVAGGSNIALLDTL